MEFKPGNEFVCTTKGTVRIYQTWFHHDEGSLNHLNLNEPDHMMKDIFDGKILVFEKIMKLKHPTEWIEDGEVQKRLQNITAYKFFDLDGLQYYISDSQMKLNFKNHFKPHFPKSKGKVILKRTLKVKTENKKPAYLKSGFEVELADVIEWKVGDKGEMIKGFQLYYNNHLYTYWSTESLFEKSVVK